MVHDKAASTGVNSSSMSFPYKHKPASSRRLSRAASPAIFTCPLDDAKSVSHRGAASLARHDIYVKKATTTGSQQNFSI